MFISEKKGGDISAKEAKQARPQKVSRL